MTRSNAQSFVVPDEYDQQRLLDLLADNYTLRSEPATVEGYVVFDTFDWRLYNKSLMLLQSRNRLYLRELANETVLESVEFADHPGFVWDLPEGNLKQRLTPIIEMRTLLKLAEIESCSTTYRVLNQDEKTVVKFCYETIQASSKQDAPALSVRVHLKPVRGYPRYARNLAERLAELGLKKAGQEDTYLKIVEACGRQPGDYSAKPELKLSPTMRADEATKVILRVLLEVIKRNETYVKQDIDTEFLHDFRVAIRRTRSALSQIKLVFPAETTARFKHDFAYIGKLSNQLRDLDVYLLDENNYRSMLPPTLQGDIGPLFDYLRQKRIAALNDVIKGLDSEEYTRILNDWEAFLGEPGQDSDTAPNGRLTIQEVAQKRIYKVYKKVVKSGQSILEQTEDEKLHALRIDCKKLRYLMEFFASLFPTADIEKLIKQLKKLQTNLGDFNDFCVQEEYLLNIADELPISDSQSRKTLVAIGSLISTLDRKRERVKGEFSRTFINFASSKHKILFQKLFS